MLLTTVIAKLAHSSVRPYSGVSELIRVEFEEQLLFSAEAQSRVKIDNCEINHVPLFFRKDPRFESFLYILLQVDIL